MLEADKRGIKVPVLLGIAHAGAFATGVRNMLPTVTYPNHTTLITGASPAHHGISANVVFDPLQKNQTGWYASDIKVPTLWDEVHAQHGVVASVSWPVSVGTSSIDFDIPEYWRARDEEDVKLVRALATPGLLPELEATTSLPFAAMFSEEVDGDDARCKLTAALIAAKHPELTTLHIVSLDHNQHKFGPGTPEAHATLERIDADIGALVDAARKVEPDLTVAVASDHGFADVSQQVNLMIPFIQAGLITLDAKGKIKSWDAEPWGSGGSAAVVLGAARRCGARRQDRGASEDARRRSAVRHRERHCASRGRETRRGGGRRASSSATSSATSRASTSPAQWSRRARRRGRTAISRTIRKCARRS